MQEEQERPDPPEKPTSQRERRHRPGGFSASRIFEDWSRFIGLILLGGIMYTEFALGQAINDLYLVIVGVLLTGDKIINALRR